MKFLIDECLSPALVSIVNQAGFECTCVRDRGLLGAKDSKLMKFLLEEDFTLVTENADDFRALFGTAELHAGLVCLGAPLRPSRTFSTKSRELMTRRSTRRFPVSASSSEREIPVPKRAVGPDSAKPTIRHLGISLTDDVVDGTDDIDKSSE